jgi:hypothetical protein
MQEITSSYDDLEKRMAIYLGLGALLLTSLYLFTQGADLWTYLIRGVLALTCTTVVGWFYGHWLRELFRQHSEEEELPENVHRQTRDPQSLEGRLVTHDEMPDVVIPAEVANSRVAEFTMPDFESPLVQSTAAASSARKASPLPAEDADLPPPPVPSGI